ncbi:MAG: guanylate kinase [Acholeplasmataceae bacterium]
MKLNDRGLLVVVSGPSGVGKGTVRKALFDMKGHNLVYSISMTTRPPRNDETDGVDYYFVDEKTFLKNIKEDRFLEWAKFVGHYYGTPKDKVEDYLDKGKEVVLEIEVDGALQVREKMKEAVFIFLVPPSKEALYNRLVERGTENPELIKDRFEKAQKEFLLAYKYDYIVVNDDVNNAADRIMAIIRAEHSRTQRSISNYMKMIGE